MDNVNERGVDIHLPHWRELYLELLVHCKARVFMEGSGCDAKLLCMAHSKLRKVRREIEDKMLHSELHGKVSDGESGKSWSLRDTITSWKQKRVDVGSCWNTSKLFPPV